jgi:glycerol-3-phosphate dehydrogenase
VIDSYNLVHAYAAHAKANGGIIRENCQAVDGAFQEDDACEDESKRYWRVNVVDADGRCDCICARSVINAAGLHGDSVDQAFLNHSSFKIIPRQGGFVVLHGSCLETPLKHIILPFPNQRTKGVLLTPTLSSHVLVGPTAVDVSERDARAARCDDSTSQTLLAFAREKLKLSSETIVTTYAGLRPATQHQDYVIEAHAGKNWVTVAGIRSTGVSASLGIAEYTVQLLQRSVVPLQVTCTAYHAPTRAFLLHVFSLTLDFTQRKRSTYPPEVPTSGCFYQALPVPLHPLAQLNRAGRPL